MNTSYDYDSYKSHDLNISMRTSSGDEIKMDFANKQSLSMRHQENSNESKDTLTYSSMQSFNFSMKSNGIDAQDKKEIEAFMKTAQPFIDSFLEELDNEAPKSPVSKLARSIAEIFQPMKEKDENTQNYVRTNIVDMFDNSLKQIKDVNKVFNDAQVLLEKTLREFDQFNKNLYA